ncbi:MAG: TetR family transcriptional regulator [Deltaproteobacteria bacterium]|nr:TetR family transcriptional regulator [Deltaproteobacteria bacterium]
MTAQPSPRGRPSGPKAERTRATILEAAAQVFAEKGYAAARLEDVAAGVGIRRASLVYYFRDKRELYDVVLSDILGELLDRYQTVLREPAPLPQRIEAIVDAWVGYVAERPAVARLLLWEAADGSPDRVFAAAGRGAAVISALTSAIREGQRQGSLQPIDPIHFIFTIVGATVFFVAAMPRMVPDWPFDPLSPQQLAAHRTQLLGIARRLLGTDLDDRPAQPRGDTSLSGRRNAQDSRIAPTQIQEGQHETDAP